MSKKLKKEVRSNFRKSVFERDKYTCQICGHAYSEKDSEPSKGIINAHHIIDRNELQNGGYVKENGITVCDENGMFQGEVSCHMIVEQWHMTGGDIKRVEEQYRPDNLYRIIKSSHAEAIRKSKLGKRIDNKAIKIINPIIEPGIQLRANKPQNVNRLSITKILPEIK